MTTSHLDILDGNGQPTKLATDLTADVHTPLHQISGPVACLQQDAWLVALDAGGSEIGSIASIAEGAVPGEGVRIGGSNLAVKRDFKNIATNTTDGSVVAAVASHKIRVHSLVLHCGSSATSATLNTKPSGAGSAISALHALGSNGVLVLPFNAAGWFETGVGEGLSMTTSAGGSSIGVEVQYSEVA